MGLARGILAGTVIILLLPYPFVVVRVYARKDSQLRLERSDYLILAALLVTTGLCTESILGVYIHAFTSISDQFQIYHVSTIDANRHYEVIIFGGLGQTPVTASETVFGNKIAIAISLSWLTAVGLVRLSILFFYIVLFVSMTPAVQASYVTAMLSICHFIAGIIANLVVRLSYVYTTMIYAEGHCNGCVDLDMWLAITSVILDAFIVAIPQIVVWRLRTQTPEKTLFIVVFGLGLSVIILSSIRSWEISRFNGAVYNTNTDNFLSLLEPTLGIIAASLPSSMTFISRLSKRRVFRRSKAMSLKHENSQT